jgi:hypothetical protein
MKNPIRIKSKWKLSSPLYITKKDKRYAKNVKQLKEWGFSDTETWSLYSPIAQFILPRLKRFKQIVRSYPAGLTPEKWDAMLGEMIFALDWSLTSDEKSMKMTPEESTANWKRYEVGMELFAKWFRDLWS